MTTLYGITNCDTVKKARRWLEKNHHDYNFKDFRKDVIDTKTLTRWLDEIGKEKLINRRSTTWKELEPEQKALFDSTPLSNEAKELILLLPTMIKRPVLENPRATLVGFDEQQYHRFFS